jgi:flagellar hook assembly protein FlgD
MINIYLPRETNVTLKVYNLLGQTVETLIDNEYLQGEHSIEWNGDRYATGIYFYRLDAGGQSITRKMSLIK